MIETKELRIGNWVIYNHGNLFSEDYFREIDFITPSVGEKSKPILLTKDILEKCGFTQLKSNNEENIFIKDRLKIWLGIRQSLCFLKDEDKNDCYYISNGGISSLNQLQNLYYFLFNKELEVKL